MLKVDIFEQGQRLVPLSEVAKLIPGRGDKNITVNTLIRWCRHGVRIAGTNSYIRLEGVLMGRRWMTTPDAVAKFLDDMKRADATGIVPSPTYQPSARALATHARVAEKLKSGSKRERPR
jgi:hypothetical protein